METNVISNEDCIKGMKERIPDNSIDLIVTDPPYNIGKDDWDKIDNYIEWCGKWLHQCERTLKDNGSFYFFHNDFEVLAELQNWISDKTDFVFKQLIVWNKRFKCASNKSFLDGFVEVDNLRNYQKMAEYCLYYTFQDETKGSPALRFIQDFLEEKRQEKEISFGTLNNICGYKAIARKWMRDYKQPRLIQRKDYNKIKPILGLNKNYDELIKKYKQKRYTFNNQKTHHSVWNYEIAPKKGHITPKPLPLIENILKHSSNKNDIVLDCFGGSGTTAKACQNLNRQYILFETNEDYVKLTKDRLRQQSLFEQAK